MKQIIEFESKLSPEEEIGGRFVTAPKDGAIHIEDISFWGFVIEQHLTKE